MGAWTRVRPDLLGVGYAVVALMMPRRPALKWTAPMRRRCDDDHRCEGLQEPASVTGGSVAKREDPAVCRDLHAVAVLRLTRPRGFEPLTFGSVDRTSRHASKRVVVREGASFPGHADRRRAYSAGACTASGGPSSCCAAPASCAPPTVLAALEEDPRLHLLLDDGWWTGPGQSPPTTARASPPPGPARPSSASRWSTSGTSGLPPWPLRGEGSEGEVRRRRVVGGR